MNKSGEYLQHTYDHIGGLLLLLTALQGVEPFPLRSLGCYCTLWIRSRLSIISSLTLVLWEVLNHVPALTATKISISALSSLLSVSMATLNTVLSGTLHITSIVLLGLGSSTSRCCTPLKVRVP